MPLITVRNTQTTEWYNVLAPIGFGIGYRISGGVINAPRPSVQILTDLNGNSFTWSSTVTSILLEVDAETSLGLVVGKTSALTTVTLWNTGTALLEVGTPTFSNLVAEAIPQYQGGSFSQPPWTISTGSYQQFGLRYKATEVGLFNEAIWFLTSDANSSTRVGSYRHDIEINSGETFTLDISPGNYTTSTILPNENSLVTYMVNVYENDELSLVDALLTATISGSLAWTIDSVSGNEVTARFDSYVINNVTATYVANLTINSAINPAVTYNRTLTATHDPNWDKNRAVSKWLSTLTQPDAIVGARIDYVNDQPTLTIGVGSGSDGSPPMNQGDQTWFREENLNPIWGRGKVPYAFWQTVYEIPLAMTTTNAVYYSRDYKKKSQEPLARDYDYYYGHYLNTGSMFAVVEQVYADNLSDVRIELAEQRATTEGLDSEVDLTLERLSRIFYYYSITDLSLGSRSTQQLGNRLDEYGNVFSGGLITNYFVGFNGVYHKTTSSGSYTATILVKIPN